ncbi:MAG: disulfide bond formation protein B [Parachlamydiales bacterium]|nr:disulfide bond formation protein B [Parachlamydiales bacterium]
MQNFFNRYVLYFAWLISCLALVGSLYYSEIRNFGACNLCWYQRICIYPLVIILGMSVFSGKIEAIPYVIPQLVIGILLTIYHVLIQSVPSFNFIDFCGVSTSCQERIDIGLGWITLPILSLVAQVLILSGIVYAWRLGNKPSDKSKASKSEPK